MEFIIFKNPRVRYRKENFGGIVKSRFQFYVLNKKQYEFLENLNKFRSYNLLNKNEKKIADVLLEKEILLKIEANKAKKILEELKKQ